MKRLFQVVLKGQGIYFFEKKPEAKEFRDMANNNTAKAVCHVQRGPDHRLYK